MKRICKICGGTRFSKSIRPLDKKEQFTCKACRAIYVDGLDSNTVKLKGVIQ